ncbi:MAG: hypothetical protein OHK0050_21700 [Roseiflexaceae bacterium]
MRFKIGKHEIKITIVIEIASCHTSAITGKQSCARRIAPDRHRKGMSHELARTPSRLEWLAGEGCGD